MVRVFRLAGAMMAALQLSPSGFRPPVPRSDASCALVLPGPSGGLRVGTRIERIHRDPKSGGPLDIIVQLWYPSDAAVSTTVPYLSEPQLGPTLLATGYYRQDSTVLTEWMCASLPAVRDAPVRQGRYPLVTMSVGLGMIRANYSLLAMDLASHGYVIAMVESPMAGMMIDAAGQVVTDTSTTGPTAAEHRERVSQWASDVGQVLRELRAGQKGFRVLQGRIDWSAVGAIGHSSGGLVAMQACESVQEVRGCIDMDGGIVTPENEPLAPFVATGVTKPVLVLRSQPIYSDADLARRGLTRTQWRQRAGAGLTGWDSLAARSRIPLQIAWIAGTGHLSFSDAPFVMPTTITRFGGAVIDPMRSRGVVTQLVLAFLGEVLTQRAGLVEMSAKRMPEVKLKTLGAKPNRAG